MAYDIMVHDFSLRQTLECGQCFRFEALGSGSGDDLRSRYFITARDKAVVAEQKDEVLTLYCDEGDLPWWHRYFDLDRNYGLIKEQLSAHDRQLQMACADKWGIHLLRQDGFEMLVTFILSQNKQIPHIKKLVEALSVAYGRKSVYRAIVDGAVFERTYYAFPVPEALADVREEDYRALKTGFRAPYLVDAVRKVLAVPDILGASGCIEEKRQRLMAIKGVGKKVADCVLLFGMAEYRVFPVDVWIKRILCHYYGDGLDGEAEFGELAGFAQQYLFYHGRELKVGK